MEHNKEKNPLKHTEQLNCQKTPSFAGTPSIFKSLRLTQIYLYGKTIITHVLHID